MAFFEVPIRPFLPTAPEFVTTLLRELGAVAFPVMSEADAVALSLEAKCGQYTEQPETYGPRGVRQAVASRTVIENTDPCLWAIANELECQLATFFGPSAFESSLAFTHRNIQRYPHDTLGIEPHWDESENRNLVVLLGLRGSGRFTVYESLAGPVKVRWTLRPGTLLLMVAPGFHSLTAKDRWVHGVDQIVGDPYRYLLGLRQYEPVVKGGEG